MFTMPISDWPAAERPREKLLQKGPDTLSDAELLAIFLRTGCRGKSAVDLSRELLHQFSGLRGLLEANRSTFCRAKGLGDAKYSQLQAVLEMSRRYLAETLVKGQSFNQAKTVKTYLQTQLRHQQKEVFSVLFMDNQHRLLAHETLFEGTINCAHVHPREVVKRALHHNAAAVILAHNHPSGIAEPSQSDRDITNELRKVLEVLDIRVVDHMIVGDNTVTSFAEMGLI
jgi:DNA repair protein RadC